MIDHLLLAEKVKAEEELKSQRYQNEKLRKEMEKAKVSSLKTFGDIRLEGTPNVVGDSEYTYQKLKNKIIYKTGGDKYLTRGKDLITRIGDMDG